MVFKEYPLAVASRWVGEMQSWRQGARGGGENKEILGCKGQPNNEKHGVCRVREKPEQPSHKERGVPLNHRNFQNQGPSATTVCLCPPCSSFSLHTGFTISHWAWAFFV